ncbi:DUF452 family protein [Marinilabiliaceae bacterium JC017]|nr:DUF452 family protein [Marinilabiliaceae bacterium JC017]
MKSLWLHQNNKNKIILFFNGWGGDHYPLEFLESDAYDVLMLYDYRDLSLPGDLTAITGRYEEVNLMAWSFGVWVAQQALAQQGFDFRRAMAINGTLKPADQTNGIPETIIVGTLKNLSERNLQKFQRRMVGGANGWRRFEPTRPRRSLADQKEELQGLIKAFREKSISENLYHCALVGQGDLIFPTANQEKFWAVQADMVSLNVPHFPFYSFTSWDEIIEIK